MKKYLSSALLSLACMSAYAASAESVRAGVHFYNNGAVQTTTVTVIVPASTNTNGIDIKTCDLNVQAGTAENIVALYPDGTEHTLFHVFGSSGTSQPCPYPISVPGGIQLGVFASGGTQNGINITYDLVN